MALPKGRRALVIASAAVGLGAAALFAASATAEHRDSGGGTTTPIKHLVVIFQENVSFDHYFATYPNAANTDGTPFHAARGTPSVNGLNTPLQAPNNPNSTQPFRLSHEQAVTCDQDHNYTDEQKAFDHGLMDLFPESVGRGAGTCFDAGKGTGLVMGYYDGNTVTALWNYAQAFAMSDNSFGTGFGPSSVGAINLVSGQTHGFTPDPSFDAVTPNDTMIGDPQPAGDICDTRDTSTQLPASTDKNIGDLLSAKGITWGWFEGGFREASGVDPSGNPTTNTCLISHANVGGVVSKDYIPHHEPFQYYRSTQNLQHLPPSSPDMIGRDDQAHHQYDLSDFWTAVDRHELPAVSFLKAPAYQDGHAGYSDPLDEQHFIVSTINRLEKTSDWSSTAVVIAYDDSDGWYDHQMGPIVNQSNDPTVDALRGTDCGTNPAAISGGYLDRCGYGPRLPLLVVSPFAKSNFVDHSVTDQTSIIRFVEDNWQTGRIGDASMDAKAGSLDNLFDFDRRGDGPSKLFLDPITGAKS
jgi:phospholipase C